MAYFIFTKTENNSGSIYRIAENQSDLNNLNIIQSDYTIIEESSLNFNAVKYGTKNIIQYSGNTITYEDSFIDFKDETNQKGEIVKSAKQILSDYISNLKVFIQNFTNNNKNHPLFNRWNDYYNQLNTLNLDNITYPLNVSLEQYFKENNKNSFHPLQLP
jgi:hypothetical protein